MAKKVFITGTSSGIGRLTALKLAQHGHAVFGTMRDPSSANAQAAAALADAAAPWPGSISTYAMDMAAEDSVEEAVAAALADAGYFDAVVNSAGHTVMGLSETLTHDDLLFQLDVNVVGPHRVLRAVLPGLRARGRGLLIHVTGTMGRLVLPAMGAFCASKAAYEALAEAYRYELAPLGVGSTIVEPGFYPTGFAARVETGDDGLVARDYGDNAQCTERLGAKLAAMLKPPQAADPDRVATAICVLINARRRMRPARVVVDPIPEHAALVADINEARADAQAEFLRAMGMDELV